MRTGIVLMVGALVGYLTLLPGFMNWQDIGVAYAGAPLVCVLPLVLVFVAGRLARSTWATAPNLVRVALLTAAAAQLVLLVGVHVLRSPSEFDRDQVIEDVRYLVAKIEEVHPNPYTHIPRTVLHDSADALVAALPPAPTDADVWRRLMALTVLLGDGHTQMLWEGVGAKLLLGQIVPYAFRNDRGTLQVDSCLIASCGAPPGAEVLAFGGIPAGEALARLARLVPHDSAHNREQELLHLLPLLLAIENDFAPIVVEYRTQGQTMPLADHPLLSMAQKLQVVEALGGLGPGMGDPYAFDIIAGGVGYIDFRSFTDRDSFRAFLEQTFATVKKQRVTQLVIDLRRNFGGDSSLGSDLLQYISPVPFQQFDSILVKVSPSAIALAKLDTTTASGDLVRYVAERTSLAPNPLRFSGQTYLLTSRLTYSSAADFASAFKCYGVGTIIGEETGGLTVSYGDQLNFRLPHTGFGFAVSYKHFYNACGCDDGRGVMPDQTVDAGQALDFALALARRAGVTPSVEPP